MIEHICICLHNWTACFTHFSDRPHAFQGLPRLMEDSRIKEFETGKKDNKLKLWQRKDFMFFSLKFCVSGNEFCTDSSSIHVKTNSSRLCISHLNNSLYNKTNDGNFRRCHANSSTYSVYSALQKFSFQKQEKRL